MAYWMHTTRKDADGNPLFQRAGNAASETMIAAGWVQRDPNDPKAGEPATKPVINDPKAGEPATSILVAMLLAGDKLTNEQVDSIIDGLGLTVNKRAPLHLKVAGVKKELAPK